MLNRRYKMIVKIHQTNNKKIVAICDENLLGKKFEEKNLQLDLSSNFYKGKRKTEQEILDIIKDAYIVNVTGKKSTEIILKIGLVDKKNIIKINNIPHAQILMIKD